MNDEIVEIPRSRLNLLEGVSKLNNELWNDPIHGMKIKEIVKEKYPNANIPEVDVVRSSKKSETEILTKVEEVKKETVARIEAFEKSQKERDERESNAKIEKSFADEIEATKKKYQLTAEGMEKVFSRMKEKNNPDVESAAAWVTDHEPKQDPLMNSNYSPSNIDLYGASSGDKEFEEINKHAFDGKWFDKEVRKINEDFVNGRGGLYGADGMGGQL